MLQINAVRDAGQPAYSQLLKLRGQDDPEKLNNDRNSSGVRHAQLTFWTWWTFDSTFIVEYTGLEFYPFTPKSDQFEIPMQPHQKYHITQYEELGFSQMKHDYTTNSHNLTYTYLLKGDGRMYFLNLGVIKG